MKILVSILFCIFSLTASAQVFQTNSSPFKFRGLIGDSMVVIPSGADTANLANPKWGASMNGALFYKYTDSTLWAKRGNRWVLINKPGGTTYTAGNGIKIESSVIRWADSLTSGTTIYVPTNLIFETDDTQIFIKKEVGGESVGLIGSVGGIDITEDVTNTKGVKLYAINLDSIYLRSNTTDAYIHKATGGKYRLAAIDSVTGALVTLPQVAATDTTGLGDLYIRNLATPQEQKRFNVRAGRLDSLLAASSAGITMYGNSGTAVALYGAGGGSGATYYGGVNIDGTTRLNTGLSGILKASSGTVGTAVSGTDLKTINGTSIIGSGDISTATLGAWSLTGNSGTAVGTNFLGTTGANSLEIRTNNVRFVRFDSAGGKMSFFDPSTDATNPRLTLSVRANKMDFQTYDNAAWLSYNNTSSVNTSTFTGSVVALNYTGNSYVSTSSAASGTATSGQAFSGKFFGSGTLALSTPPANTISTSFARAFNYTSGIGDGSVNRTFASFADIGDLTTVNGYGKHGVLYAIPRAYVTDTLFGIYYNPSLQSTPSIHYGAIIGSGQVGIGTISPAASSALDITSTTQGVLVPRMTTTQRNAIASPADGLIVYDQTLNATMQYVSGVWQRLGMVYSPHIRALRDYGVTAYGGSISNPVTVNTTGAMSTQQLQCTAMFMEGDSIVSGIRYYLGAQGNFTANNTNSVSLYSVSGGTATKIAESANSDAIWKATANTWNTAAFATPVYITRGLYYGCGLYNQSAVTTNPTLGQTLLTNAGSTAIGTFKQAFVLTSQTTAPATITISSSTNSAAVRAFILY